MKLEERRRLHGLNSAELQKELTQAEETMMQFNFDRGLNKNVTSSSIHNTRKMIAILKTLLREKELVAEAGFNSIEEYKKFRAIERKAYKAGK